MASDQSKTKVFRRLPLHIACASILLPTGVLAQSEDADEDAVEEIVVTGSRIKRRDLIAPSPISTLERTDIAAAPQATMEELLNQMPQVVPDASRSLNNGSSGTAKINLRGMGAGRTLVMLNSRRLAPSGVGSSVDINNIPQVLIERVELITGGASTVYGSDALAGVVNFITRDDFDGVTIEANYGTTEKGDATYSDLNVAFGSDFADGDGNVVLYGGYYDREELFADKRELTRHVWLEDTDNGTLIKGGSVAVPDTILFFPEVDYGNGLNFSIFDADGTPREFDFPSDLYNWQEVNYIQTPLTRYTAGIMATYALNDQYEVYLESSFARNEAAKELAPVPVFGFFAVNTDNPLLTPETSQWLEDNALVAPDLAAVYLGRRMLETGPRHADTNRDFSRTVLGIKGEIAADWEINGWVTYTKSDEVVYLLNDVSASRFEQSLLVDPVTNQCFDPSGGCVGADIFGPGRMSGESAAFLRIPAMTNTTERIQKLASVYVTGSPIDSWAGPIDIAAGLEWRSDSADFKADDYLFSGDALGWNGDAPVNGTESVAEIYTEAVVPLLKNVAGAEFLGIEFGARYSKYENAGGVWTYKFGGMWDPVESVRVRAMYQSSTRAPNNLELFQEQYSFNGPYVFADPDEDPCSASADPVGNGYEQACIMQGLAPGQIGVFEATPQFPVEFINGGNPNLVPEVAETLTVGAIFTPSFLPDWNFTIDFYDMEITDNIGEVYSDEICFDQANVENVLCDQINRDPITGNINEVFSLFNNRGLISTRGIDTQIHYSSDLPDGLSLFGSDASFTMMMVWTHTLSLKAQENAVSSVIACEGFFGNPCRTGSGTGAEDRVAINFNYRSGPLGITLTSRWIGGTKNFRAVKTQYYGGSEPILAIPSIGSHHYLNLNVAYEFTDAISASLGIANLLDRQPPMMANNTGGNNTDSLMYDIYGRAFNLSLRMTFGN